MRKVSKKQKENSVKELVFDAKNAPKPQPKVTGRLVFQFDDGELNEVVKIYDNQDAILSLSTSKENQPSSITFKDLAGRTFKLFIEEGGK